MLAEFITRYGILFLGIGISLIGAFVMLIWYCWRFYQLHNFGKNARGYITDRRIVNRGKTISYLVCIGFDNITLNGDIQSCNVEQSVSETTYKRLMIGTPVTVRYVANRPTIARLTAKFTDNSGPYQAIFLFVVYIAGFIFIGLFTLFVYLQPH
jgi:hypothetical protein